MNEKPQVQKQKGKNRLHALLALEGDVKSRAEMIRKETIITFAKKPDHFTGLRREYVSTKEGGIEQPMEQKQLVTTVPDKLAHLDKTQAQVIDAVLQKEVTNTVAKADLVLDDEVIAENLPATAYLSIENLLKARREVILTIPTHAPGEVWDVDEKAGMKGVYKSPLRKKLKTEKEFAPVVMHPGSEHHPPMIKELFKDVVIGYWEETKFTGTVTPKEKSDMLTNCDRLIGAVKKARQRANDAEIVKIHLGKKLLKYVNTGSFS